MALETVATEAINIFIQQSLNVEGLPFVVTPKSKAAKFEQAVGRTTRQRCLAK